MTIKIPRSRDFWAGVTFMLVGALAIYFGSDLAMGDVRRMGPRYFPTLAAGGLLVIGAIVAFRGLGTETDPVKAGAVKPVLILLSVLLFGLLLRPFGFVIATVTMIAVASLAGPRMRLVELVALAAALTAFSWLIFVWALGLPLQTWPA